MAETIAHDLKHYDVSPERGFLPEPDPLTELPSDLQYVDEMGELIPELIRNQEVNEAVRDMEIPSEERINALYGRELKLAWVRYGFLQSACVHNQSGPHLVSPRNVAVPMWYLSRRLNKPPILAYDGYTLYNWKRKNLDGPITIENLELIQSFAGTPDQAWFILIHVNIEYEAAMAIRNAREAVLAVERSDAHALECALLDTDKALGNMIATMKRMPEGTFPETYHEIRPWIMSFENVVYKGVEEYRGRPQSFRGQTGAQTSIFQSLEAGLQMPQMEVNELARYLKEMRIYMPSGHRQFIRELEIRSRVREFVVRRAPYLAGAYNSCVGKICDFLDTHFGYAVTYIHRKTSNPKGTGGSDFMKYLKGRLDERRDKAYLRT